MWGDATKLALILSRKFCRRKIIHRRLREWSKPRLAAS
jgi:hypothetical protein